MGNSRGLPPSFILHQGEVEDQDDESAFLSLLKEFKTVHGITVQLAMRILGIDHTKDTPVGDAMIR